MKFIKDLTGKLPFFLEEDICGRDKYFAEQKETYGVDPRECWNLDHTFIIWLYNRLKIYDRDNIIDTNYRRIEINGKTLTIQGWIDNMISLCEEMLLDDEARKTEELLDIFKEVIYYLWW